MLYEVITLSLTSRHYPVFPENPILLLGQMGTEGNLLGMVCDPSHKGEGVFIGNIEEVYHKKLEATKEELYEAFV